MSKKEHIASKDCWCQPVQDHEESTLWIHHDTNGYERALEDAIKALNAGVMQNKLAPTEAYAAVKIIKRLFKLPAPPSGSEGE